MGAAVRQGAEVIAQVGKKFADLRDLKQTTEAHTNAQQQLIKLEQDAERDENPFDTEKYAKEIQRIKNESAKGIADPAARIRFQGSLDMSAMQSQASITDRLRRRQIDASLAELARSNETRGQAFQSAGTPQEKKIILAQMYQSIDAFAANSVISKEGAGQMKAGLAPRLIEGEISRDMRVDPSGTLSRLDNGYYEQIAPLDVERKSKLREMTEAMEKKRQAEAEKQNAEAMDELHRNVLLGIVDETTGVSELRGMLESKQISAKDYTTMVDRLKAVNDSADIPEADKVARLFDVSQRFSELHAGFGRAKVDPKTRLPEKEVRGNRLQQLREFRNYLAESAPYLTKEQERAFLVFTQRNLNTATSAKAGLFSNFTKWLSSAFGPSEGAREHTSKALQVFDEKMPLNMAEQSINQLKTQATFAGNPNRTRYTVGQTITNPNGLQAVVDSFDENGNPVLKWKK